MALVVLLKGVNVGGHRTFRPTMLARQMTELRVVNIGAAGTFVVHGARSATALRSAILRQLPFDTQVMICTGRELLRLIAEDPFAGQRTASDVVPFVSILARRRTPTFRIPLMLPERGRWSLRILGCRDRFVFGQYRRQMKAIGYLERLEKLFGVPVTTRGWNTVRAIGDVLERGSARG